MAEKLERKIEFTPAFDRRNPDPHRNYGIHGAEMRWNVIGEKGAVQFVVFTNWMLPHVWDEQEVKRLPVSLTRPFPADVGYHSRTPMYEGQESRDGVCHLLPGGKCYYDGSGLAADEVFKKLVAEGSEAVWRELEYRWREQFEPELLENLTAQS